MGLMTRLGMDWARLNWVAHVGAGLDWIQQGSAGLGCAGLGCAGLASAGLGGTGLGWAGLRVIQAWWAWALVYVCASKRKVLLGLT